MSEDKKVICPDPDCKTENEAKVPFCSKCGLDFEQFNGLSRILDIREARKAAEEKAKKEEADKNKPKSSGLAGLVRGRK